MNTVTKERATRLLEERARTEEKRQDILTLAEKADGRALTDSEQEQVEMYRTRVEELDTELEELANDLERENKSQRASALIRVRETPDGGDTDGDDGDGGSGEGDGRAPYRSFHRFARDQMIVRYPSIANAAGDGDPERVRQLIERAQERLSRAIQNTTTSDIEGLLPPQHMAEILDIINGQRPVVATARRVDLSRGKLTYPKIVQRPDVQKQNSEKTQAGSVKMQIDLEDMNADTYLGAGDLSWQAINWSTPDALQTWFTLAAEAYARATETAACAVLEAAASGTVSPSLGTTGTEDFAAWRAAAIGGVGSIYTSTSGRARTDTLYLAADQFFALAALSTDAVVQMSTVGNLDVGAMTGTFSGLRVVGSYGFQPGTRILGDGSAFLVGETPGAPVELRAVEPAIGGMEVGVIGAFQAAVYDEGRFLFLS